MRSFLPNGHCYAKSIVRKDVVAWRHHTRIAVAQTLKENDPRIEITWVVRSRFEPLVRAFTAVDRTVTFYRARGTAEFANRCKN